jgi:hypothetical protein
MKVRSAAIEFILQLRSILAVLLCPVRVLINYAEYADRVTIHCKWGHGGAWAEVKAEHFDLCWEVRKCLRRDDRFSARC